MKGVVLPRQAGDRLSLAGATNTNGHAAQRVSACGALGGSGQRVNADRSDNVDILCQHGQVGQARKRYYIAAAEIQHQGPRRDRAIE